MPNNINSTSATAYATETKSVIKPANLYQVIMLDDDVTTMDFVVNVLTIFFNMNLEQAQNTMLKIHNKGSAVCATYSRDIAETKAFQVNRYAREHNFPLTCKIQEIQEKYV